MISIVARSLFLESGGGTFIDRIEGTSATLKDLLALVQHWQEPVLF
ncbi:MAG TPA: hypothetical protein VGF67_30050 [Ktedonobacteraceae bacterium]